MGKLQDSIVSYSSGEWSSKADARVDQAKYKSALRQCQNLVPYKTGGLTRRPGTQKIAAAKLANTAGHDYCVRPQEFIFSPTTTFMLEFGNNYVRFFSNGAPVTITAADLDFWLQYNAYNPGDYVKYLGISYTCILAVTATIPPFFHSPPNVDTTHWMAQPLLELPTPYNADAGASGPQPGSIYDTDVWNLAFCQINDVVYISSPDFPPYRLTRITDQHWNLSRVDFLVPALLDQNATNTQITASATTGTGITLTASAPAWVTATYYNIGNSVEVSSVIYTAIAAHVSGAVFTNDLAAGKWEATPVFNALHVGSTWQLAYLRPSAYLEVTGVAATGFSDGTSGTIKALGGWEVHTYGVWSSDIAVQRSLDGGQTWNTVRSVTGRSDRNVDITGRAVQVGLYRIVVSNSAALVNAGATNPRIVFECVDSFLFGLVKITAFTSALVVTADVVTELASTSATEFWSEAAWSEYRGYPSAVTSFQQRVIYGASGFEPQRIWGTVTNDIENFDRGDQTLATDSFAFDLNAPGRGPIQWLIAQTDLFAGFSGAEWVVNSGSTSSNNQVSGAAITATSINAVEHSTWGTAGSVLPAIVGNAVIFTQRQATSIRQMMFSIYTNKYMSQDLTAVADHMFASGIAQLCYMTRWRKQSIIWAVTKQGTLCGMTYELDQEVFGWHRHTTGGGQVDANGNPMAADFGFEGAAVIPGQGNNDDEVWIVANRIIGGVNTRFIERINPFNWEEDFVGAPVTPAPFVADAFYVDCGSTITSPGTTLLTGMGYLEGRSVVGLADGQAFGPIVVSGGMVQLPASVPAAVEVVQIGLPIPYFGQPMRIDADPRVGSTQGMIKQISDVYVRVWNSMGGSISNGTTKYPTWVSGGSYGVGDLVISPLTQGAYQCVTANVGATDPSQTGLFVAATVPTYNPPIPIPYTNNPTNPFAAPTFVSTPTDIRITPMLAKWPDSDPQFIIQGNDALPITVLATIYKYDLISAP